MPKGGSTINLDVASLLKSLSNIELDDLRNKLIYAGYATSEDIIELIAAVSLFIDDKNLNFLENKEDLWVELINHGYKLGDRILNFSKPELRGSDVEELQELLSRLGFYSEPINGVFNTYLAESVTEFQENRGLSVDGNVGLDTVHEIKMLIRPNLNTSLNEAIKSISPNLNTSTLGYTVCFDIPNDEEYAEQIETYEITKKICLENNIISSFASEIGQDVKEENIINYVNKLQPTLFISFKKSSESSIAFFKGSFTESRFGNSMARKISSQLKIDMYGKAHNLLKDTKSVSLIFFGNFYQNDKLSTVLENILQSLNESLEI
ncbi:peptidoglycan-binding protein [Candidatus Actinomarina]|nr:peptidoglycan-binding protein [Candidatus Actinomarina sp.]